ncbi:MAG TPA: hypothetical protein VHX66_08235 [Solirubrobacteraceae bacterium]|nr:hypothetical protein [Solirubrobacteraceae bacterium]
MRVHGVVERYLDMGRDRVRLRFAGASLAEALLPAFGPRATADDGGPPAASIDLWEEALVPGGHAPVPWSDHDLGPRGLLRGPAGCGMHAVHEGSGTVTLVDKAARTIRYRVPSTEALPWWERAAPMRPALFWALAGNGRHLVHAGAVGDERGGILLVGAGGSGKTTMALAALMAGLRYVGDDYLLITTNSGPQALNVFATAKLDEGHVERFPELAAQARRIGPTESEPDEKLVLDVPSACPGALTAALTLRAVAVPRITGGTTAVRATSAGNALLALAPSTVMQMPYDGGATLAPLGRLLRPLPSFAVDVGDDRDGLAAALDEVLERATGPSRLVATS